MGRPRIGTPDEAAARKRAQTAARVRRLRERRRAEAPASPPSAADPPVPAAMSADYGIAAARLRLFVEQIERLETELAGTRTRNPALAAAWADQRRQIQAELKSVWKELEGIGFSAAVTREILRLRKMGDADRHEFETLVGLYKQALGMD